MNQALKYRLYGSLLIPLALAAPAQALAQRAAGDSSSLGEATHPHPRSLVLGIAGAVIGGLAAFGFSKGGQSSAGSSAVLGAAAGGLAGFFVGRQLDERRRISYRGVSSLRIPNVAITLDGDPTVLAVRGEQIAVGGSSGVQIFSATDPRLQPIGVRAVGLHGIGAVDIAAGTPWLVLGSRTGLYIYPPTRGPGVLVRRGSISSIAATDTRIFVGAESRVEMVPVNADTARDWPGTTLGAPVHDVLLEDARTLLWVSTDRELAALRIAGDSLIAISSLPLAGIGLRVTTHGSLAAVAMGEKGVAVFDITDALHPKPRGVWTVAHFAYDVSIDGTRMFVAAGPEGVYVVDISDTTPRTVGLARALGFASAIVSADNHTFILDRRINALRRIISTY